VSVLTIWLYNADGDDKDRVWIARLMARDTEMAPSEGGSPENGDSARTPDGFGLDRGCCHGRRDTHLL
jgi:hypothetical protein